MPSPSPLSPYARAFFTNEMVELHRATLVAAADRARVRFEDMIAHAGVRGEWRQVAGLPANLTNVIALHARYADVVIVGQADPEEDEPNHAREAGRTDPRHRPAGAGDSLHRRLPNDRRAGAGRLARSIRRETTYIEC